MSTFQTSGVLRRTDSTTTTNYWLCYMSLKPRIKRREKKNNFGKHQSKGEWTTQPSPNLCLNLNCRPHFSNFTPYQFPILEIKVLQLNFVSKHCSVRWESGLGFQITPILLQSQRKRKCCICIVKSAEKRINSSTLGNWLNSSLV